MRALILSGRLWPLNILTSRVGLLVAIAPFNCNSIPVVDKGDTGLYIVDGQYFDNTAALVLSEKNFHIANASILLLHRPSDL